MKLLTLCRAVWRALSFDQDQASQAGPLLLGTRPVLGSGFDDKTAPEFVAAMPPRAGLSVRITEPGQATGLSFAPLEVVAHLLIPQAVILLQSQHIISALGCNVSLAAIASHLF